MSESSDLGTHLTAQVESVLYWTCPTGTLILNEEVRI